MKDADEAVKKAVKQTKHLRRESIDTVAREGKGEGSGGSRGKIACMMRREETAWRPLR